MASYKEFAGSRLAARKLEAGLYNLTEKEYCDHLINDESTEFCAASNRTGGACDVSHLHFAKVMLITDSTVHTD